MKKVLLILIICLITSQILAWILSIIGLVFYTPSNAKTGIACFNISNFLTFSSKQKARNYNYIGGNYTILQEGNQSLLAREKAAKLYGSCDKYKKCTTAYEECRGNTILLALTYYTKGDFEKSIETYKTINAYSAMIAPYILMKDYKNALICAKKAAERGKSYDYFNLATVYRFVDDVLAEQYYNKALSLAKAETLSNKQINKYNYQFNNYKTYYIEQQTKMHNLQNF